MKKKISFLLVVVLILATLIPALPVLAADETTGGETITNTFNFEDANPTISTKDDYIAFFKAAFVENKNFSGKNVTLLHDITFNDTTDADWYAKDGVTKLDGEKNGWYTFEGTFDGGNHTLKGVIVDGLFSSYCTGLFPHVGDKFAIKNLNIDGFYVRSHNTTKDSKWGDGATGGLIGRVAGGQLTIENCTMKNGIVTAVKDGLGPIGALIGHYHAGSGSVSAKITNTTVTDVRVEKGESKCTNLGGIFGMFLTQVSSGDIKSVLDFSGSVFQPVGSIDSAGKWENTSGGVAKYVIINGACGAETIAEVYKTERTSDCNKQFTDCGIYGENAAPTVKLLGVQNSTTGNGIRFVGLIKKSAIDAGTVTALGFELTSGGKSAEAECTKVYESILEDGKTLTAPEGYYFFTFVVTDVAAGTEFAVNAVAAVGETACTTTEGIYTYPHTES